MSPQRLRLVGRRAARQPLRAPRLRCSPRCRCSRGSIRGRHGERRRSTALASPATDALGGRRHRHRPRGAGADDRGPRRAALRRSSTDDRVTRRPSRRPTAAAPRWTRCATTSSLALNAAGYDDVDVRMMLAPAWTTDWMTRCRQAQAARVRHRPAHGPRRRCSRARSGCSSPSSARAAARSTRARSRGSGRHRARRCTSAATASSRSTTSRCSDAADGRRPRTARRRAARFHAARGRRGAPAHRATASRSPSRCPTSCAASTTTCRAVRRPARERRRARGAPQLLDLPRRPSPGRISVAIKRDLGGLFSTWAHDEPRRRRPARRDEPAGHVHLEPRPTSTARTSPASPQARASRR